MPRIKSLKQKNYIKINVMTYALHKDLEISEIAKRMKMSKSTLYRQLSNPNSLRLGTINNLCTILDCDISSLLSKN